jgi:hypothetical protein
MGSKTIFREVALDATTIGPRTIVAEWLEIRDTTTADATYRTFEPVRPYARLVVPIPRWIAGLLYMVGV